MSSLASVGSLKITPPKWDSDRDAEKFVKWFREMGAVVRSLPHGSALQAFLEKKLGTYIPGCRAGHSRLVSRGL